MHLAVHCSMIVEISALSIISLWSIIQASIDPTAAMHSSRWPLWSCTMPNKHCMRTLVTRCKLPPFVSLFFCFSSPLPCSDYEQWTLFYYNNLLSTNADRTCGMNSDEGSSLHWIMLRVISSRYAKSPFDMTASKTELRNGVRFKNRTYFSSFLAVGCVVVEQSFFPPLQTIYYFISTTFRNR